MRNRSTFNRLAHHLRTVLLCLALLLPHISANAQSGLCDRPETAIIAKRIAQVFILKYGKPAEADQRRFSYVAYDLNRDHKMEYLVVLLDIGGTGGRMGFLLGHDLDVITAFSLVKFPVYVSTHIYHDDWPDLYIKNWGGWHVGHYAGGYGVNPSVWCMEDSVNVQHLRVLFEKPYAEICTF
jgi:hypothetical protein